MFVKLYSNSQATKWLGWIEDAKGNALGYIRLSGAVLWMGGVQ